MAAARRGARPSQIGVEVRVQRPGDVTFPERARPPLGSGELEAAVEDGPLWVVEMGGEVGRLDQRARHGRIFGPNRLSLQSRQLLPRGKHGNRGLLGERQPVRLACAAGARVQAAAVRESPAAVLPAGAQVAADARPQSPRPRAFKDGNYVCSEARGILYSLDLKYREPPIFGRTPEEAGTIMRVICEYQAYIEPHVTPIVNAVFGKANRGTGEAPK